MPAHTAKSDQLFKRACLSIPGGVNSPVRACHGVEASPLFIHKGAGSHIWSADGNEYIDFVMSWGPLLLGHAHPEVTAAVIEAAKLGMSFGAPCENEVRLAEAVKEAMPHIEMVRMVNSGTEATMSALRLARGYTGRSKFIKFTGCYHGHGDAFLAAAGSGFATLSIPGTPGVPETVVEDTLLAPYNNLDAVKKLFEANPEKIAAVFVEPAAGNMGLVLPETGFLAGLRALCDQYGALLIFDEVICGFRLSYGGAAKRFGITPDLTTLGKIIGGGLPVGAYGGKREIMEHVAPLGDVYQAGTLSGNPLAMAAGLTTLEVLKNCDYPALEARVESFCCELESVFHSKAVPARINRIASLFTIFFTEREVKNFEDSVRADKKLYTQFYAQMREMGINLAPSPFECAMLSFAHSDQDFEKALEAARKVEFVAG